MTFPVVCVTRGLSSHPGLIVGNTYTVTSVMHERTWTGYLLAEIAPSAGCCCFLSQLFQPAVEHKADISIFTDMLLEAENV
ncbi:hypothetical protein [Bradyrhizobium sp. Tv2a-2]|uniref:hypothetical protein n=1 Tax=Bradyrhizobium sp. Tv2a-2 TaxID=113395 RepID=UPI0003F55357|nr:hypothetical protein [Bradyrhizobium sp. Tv2a-2]